MSRQTFVIPNDTLHQFDFIGSCGYLYPFLIGWFSRATGFVLSLEPRHIVCGLRSWHLDCCNKWPHESKRIGGIALRHHSLLVRRMIICCFRMTKLILSLWQISSLHGVILKRAHVSHPVSWRGTASNIRDSIFFLASGCPCDAVSDLKWYEPNDSVSSATCAVTPFASREAVVRVKPSWVWVFIFVRLQFSLSPVTSYVFLRCHFIGWSHIRISHLDVSNVHDHLSHWNGEYFFRISMTVSEQ